MAQRHLLGGALIASVLILTGCGGSDGGNTFQSTPVTPPDPTLSSIQDELFTPTCALSGCHAGSQPQAGLNLQSGNSFINLVGIASTQLPGTYSRVEPLKPDDSYLILKLEGDPSIIVGERMPFGGPALDQAVIDPIRTWISEGAQDN